MTAQLAPTPIFKAFDNNGFPLAFGFLTTYRAGTLVPQATYIDSTQTTQNTNPIQLNFRGECALWLDPTLTYKFALTDAFGHNIPGYPVDNITGGFTPSAIAQSLIPNPTNTFTLGDATHSWANVYLGPDAAPAFDTVSGNIGYYARTPAEIAASITPTDYAYPPGSPYYDTRRTGALTDNSTDNTAAVLRAIKALNGTTTQGGGIVYNPKNSQFNLSTLTGVPARFELWYYGGDDLSDSTVVGTNELRCFVANANASGIANEHRLEAAYGPGQIINVRKNLTLQDPWLGGGQSRTNPARTFWAMKDEDQDSFGIIYQNYPVQSGFAGTNLVGYRRIVTLNGITNVAFGGGSPGINNTLIGLTSGAKGFVVSTDASKTIVIWIGGTFVGGETVNNGTNTSSTTISTAPFSELQTVPLGIGMQGNGWAVGLPTDLTTYPLTVGGPIGVSGSRSASWYTPITYASPFLELVDAYENAPPNGFQIFYNTVPAAANRRVTLRKYNTSTDLAHMGAVRAFGQITDSALFSASAYNIASVVKNATGDYTVNFTVAFTRADYSVTLTPTNGTDYPFVFVQAVGSVRIQVATNGTPGTLRNIGAGGLNIMCLGGDI